MKTDFRVMGAFLGVVSIWGTTPLAIQWSNADNGYLFSIAARMSLGAMISLAILFVFRGKLVFNKVAFLVYLTAGLGLYLGMLLVYRSAAVVPSGWIAVMFSMNPLFTSVLAHVILTNEKLTLWRVLSLILGIGGVILIFMDSLDFSHEVALGLVWILVSVLIHATSSVIIRHLSTGISPMAINTGAHIVAVPLFVATWLLNDFSMDLQFSLRSGLALLYLAVFGSIFGFIFYYYLIQRIGAGRSSIIMMITPFLGLFLGSFVNDEPVSGRLFVGAIIVICGVGLNLWFSRAKIKPEPMKL